MRVTSHALRSLIPVAARCALALGLAAFASAVFAGKNQAPSATLTSPANGASYLAPAEIPLAASASDKDGTVVRVDFYSGTTLIGTATTPPYTATWSNVPVGTYSVTAKATDNNGAVGTSAAATVTVASATALVISSPADGAFINRSSFSIIVSGTYEGPTSGNTILIDTPTRSTLAAITGNSYTNNSASSYYLLGSDFNVGPNTLTVRLERADLSSVTRSITVHGYDTPVVAFTAPSAATFTAPATVTFAVDAVAPGGTVTQVAFQRNGTPVGTVTSPPYQVTLSGLGNGSYTISAFATSNRGPVGSTSTTIQVLGPNTPPVVSITSPASGANFIQGSSVPITVSASDPDGTVTLVEYFANGAPIGTTNVAPFGFTWANAPLGSHALTARATDNRSGQTTSAPVNITVSPPNQPPSVSLTSPASGAIFTSPATVNLAASASDPDGSVAKVEFFQGATLLATVSAPPYTFSWTNVAAGSYSLTAKATDNSNAVTTSAPVAITVSAPAITISTPTNGASINGDRVLVIGTVSAPQFSGIQVNGVVAFSDQSGNFYANNVALATGANTVTATLTRTDGTTSTSVINVSSTGPAPIRIEANPLEGGVPLTVAYIVTPTGGASLLGADFDFEGTGTVDYTLLPPNTGVNVTYPSATVYLPVVTATDSLGRIVQRRFAVLVDANPDTKLRATFNAMLDKLRAGDVDGALTYLTGGAAPQYATIFNALKQAGTLTAAVNSLGTLRGSTVGPDIGELILSRDTPGGPVAYPIWLLRGPDGIWRIESM